MKSADNPLRLLISDSEKWYLCFRDGNGHTPNSEVLYCCSYDFVARNSSELSVLQGETLEVDAHN